jgi:antitoxin YefM
MYNINMEVIYVIATSYSTVRQNFKDYCDKATNDFETIIITRERGDNVVMMSESEYNNLMENLYVRSNPTYYNELLKSIEQLKMGKGVKRELLDE